MTNERGFSLVEVMIAMIILTVGILGLAASSAAVARMTAEGSRSGAAAGVAATRFEMLRATAAVSCTGLAAGSATTGRFSERWSLATSGLLRTVTDSISYTSGRTTRNTVYVAQISCAPKAT